MPSQIPAVLWRQAPGHLKPTGRAAERGPGRQLAGGVGTAGTSWIRALVTIRLFSSEVEGEVLTYSSSSAVSPRADASNLPVLSDRAGAAEWPGR